MVYAGINFGFEHFGLFSLERYCLRRRPPWAHALAVLTFAYELRNPLRYWRLEIWEDWWDAAVKIGLIAPCKCEF
jgi:hypothetical protein